MVEEIWNNIPITTAVISVKYCVITGAESETRVPSGVIKANETIKMNNAVLFNSAFKKKVVKMIAIGKWCIAIP
jgi:hypothetical protein